jgi:hypothetical protein
LWGFQQANPAFGLLLAFRALEEFLGRSLGVVACSGREEKATVRLDPRLPGSQARGQRPCAMGDHLHGLRSLAWSSPLALASRGADRALLHVRRLYALWKGGQGLPCVGFPGPGRAAQLLEGLRCLGPGLQERLVDRALGLRVALARRR